ncbi:MAG TPA: hypothetical protein VM166_10940 [Gemmatimonadaceae bacterium]|nr:hypothetical protein [Gemmatimonadaceae bacterium]
MSCSVQRFLAQSVILLSVVAAVSTRAALAQSNTVRLRIGLIVPVSPSPAATSVARGVRLGASESKQTAALFGGDVELFEVTATGPAEVITAAQRLLSRSKVHILIGVRAEDIDALSRFAEAHSVLLMNAASRTGTLRSACRRHTFHLEAADIAYQNAIALGRSDALRAGAPRGTDAVSDSVVLWSSVLVRFGASQLSDRFRTMFNADMNGEAWAGWIAVKTASEAVLHTRSAESKSVIAYLEAASTQFDGHKGWPLTFRRSDHQLRQPLYIVAPSRGKRTDGSRSIRDVPDISELSSGAQVPSTVLDRLNAPPGNHACAWLPL